MAQVLFSLIIPTYNEKENILRLIKELQKNLNSVKELYEIIAVDDNSPDGTGAAAEKAFRKNKNIRIFVRKKDRGLATAIFFGINKSKGDVVVGMDADFNHPPELIPQLSGKLIDADMVVASRFINGGGMEEKGRYFFTYFFNLFLKYLLGFPTMDNMSGYYAIKKPALLKLPLGKIYRGYGEYHLRLVYLAQKIGLKIKEIPVFYSKRNYGQSKSNLIKLFFSYLWTALNLKTGKNF